MLLRYSDAPNELKFASDKVGGVVEIAIDVIMHNCYQSAIVTRVYIRFTNYSAAALFYG